MAEQSAAASRRRARRERLLAQGEFPDYEDICREILLVEYPEEVPHETAEDFDELSWDYILDDVFASNTAKGIQMWRSLLNIAEPSLKTDAKTAMKNFSRIGIGWFFEP